MLWLGDSAEVRQQELATIKQNKRLQSVANSSKKNKNTNSPANFQHPDVDFVFPQCPLSGCSSATHIVPEPPCKEYQHSALFAVELYCMASCLRKLWGKSVCRYSASAKVYSEVLL